MKTAWGFLLLLPLLIPNLGWGETYKYVILSGEDTTGYLEVSKEVKNDTIFYEYKSDASVTFLKTFHVIATKQTCYVKDKMMYCETLNQVNGDVRDYCKAQWENGKYRIVEKDGDEKTQDIPVYFSSIRLFFERPDRLNDIYSETKTKFNKISVIDENTFEVDGGFARSSTFFYKDNKLVKVRVNIPIIKFELVLMES